MPQSRTIPVHYGTVSLFLHWLTALLILCMFVLGWGREYAPGSWRPAMMDVHKSIGILILGIVFFRMVWRFFVPPPPLPEGFPSISKHAAHAGHAVLYILMILMPLSGWAAVSAMGREVVLFGGFALTSLVVKTPALVPVLKEVHEFMAYGLATLIAGHTGAALLHHFFYRDNTLRRMLPLLKAR